MARQVPTHVEKVLSKTLNLQRVSTKTSTRGLNKACDPVHNWTRDGRSNIKIYFYSTCLYIVFLVILYSSRTRVSFACNPCRRTVHVIRGESGMSAAGTTGLIYEWHVAYQGSQLTGMYLPHPSDEHEFAHKWYEDRGSPWTYFRIREDMRAQKA